MFSGKKRYRTRNGRSTPSINNSVTVINKVPSPEMALTTPFRLACYKKMELMNRNASISDLEDDNEDEILITPTPRKRDLKSAHKQSDTQMI